MTESNLGSLRDEESEDRLRHAQELQALREKMEAQVSSGALPFSPSRPGTGFSFRFLVLLLWA